MILNQTKHKETEREQKLLNGRMLQFIFNHVCYCVPMTILSIDGKSTKKPMNGYSWANLTEEGYRRELERARLIQDPKLRQKELYRLNRQCTGIKALKAFNYDLSFINTAIHSNDSYLVDSIKDEYNSLLKSVSAFSLLAQECNLIVFDCDTEDHNSADVTHATDCPSLFRLQQWCRSVGLSFDVFLNTFIVRTTSGGYHFYFFYTGNAIKKKIGFVKGIDLIAGHNLITAPFSAKTFDNGQVIRYLPVQLQLDNNQIKYSYLSLSKANEIQMLPKELEQAIIKAQTPVRSHIDFKEPKIYAVTDINKRKATRILMKNLHDFACTGQGQRHEALLKHVRNVFMFYQYLQSEYNQDEILTMFRDKALTLGLHQSEIETPLYDSMKFGLDHQKTLI